MLAFIFAAFVGCFALDSAPPPDEERPGAMPAFRDLHWDREST